MNLDDVANTKKRKSSYSSVVVGDRHQDDDSPRKRAKVVEESKRKLSLQENRLEIFKKLCLAMAALYHHVLSTDTTIPSFIAALELDRKQHLNLPSDGFYRLGPARLANHEPMGGLESLLACDFLVPRFSPPQSLLENHRYILGRELYLRTHFKEYIRKRDGNLNTIYLFHGEEDGYEVTYGLYEDPAVAELEGENGNASLTQGFLDTPWYKQAAEVIHEEILDPKGLKLPGDTETGVLNSESRMTLEYICSN